MLSHVGCTFGPRLALTFSGALCVMPACGDGEGDTGSSTSASTSAETSGESSGTTTGGSANTSTVFVNFDGGDFVLGEPDAATNSTDNEVIGGSTLGAYNVGPARAEVLAAVQADFGAYGIAVTDTRPASGAYSMVVVSSDNPFGSFIDSFATVDCGDARDGDVAFAFSQLTYTSEQMGALVSRQVGHMLGLEAVADGNGDVMQENYEVADPGFTDTCLGLALELQCGSQHAEFCASGQNAHAELSAHGG